MPGTYLSDALAPHLGDHDAIITVQYAERGVDDAQIHRLIMGEVDRISPARLRIYGASMGGLCAAGFLARYRRAGAPYGPAVLVLDTSPSGSGDVRQPQVLFSVAARYRGGPLTTAGWATMNRFRNHPPSEPGTDPRTTDRARHAGAWTGMPAMTSQAAYIGEFRPPQTSDLAPVVRRAVYLRGRGHGGEDPLIHIDSAIAGWRRTLPDLTVVTFDQRRERWHLPLVERPQETVRALLTV
jgi:hypothetical protein